MGAWRGVWRATVVVVCVAFVVPLVFLVLGSLRPVGLPPPDGFAVVVDGITTEPYRLVDDVVPSWWRAFAASGLVALVAVPVTVVVASWAGLAIVLARPAVRRPLLAVVVLALLVPPAALWVPRFVLLSRAGLTDSLGALVVPALAATTPFYVLLFALAYSRIPRSCFDAARLAGAGPLRLWWRVARPLGRSATFAVAVLAFSFHWSNLVDGLLYLTSEDLLTVPVALRRLAALEPTMHPILLAGAVMATVPVLVAFLLAHRAFLVRTVEGD